MTSRGGYGEPGGAELPTPYTWVYGRNAGSTTIDRWTVAAITGIAATPTSDNTAAATQQFQTMPIVTLAAWSSSAGAVGVAVEPIPAGGIGRVAVGGAVQVKAADTWKVPAAVLYKGDDWGLVALGHGFRVGTIASTWTKGATATVTQQQGDGTAISPTQTFTARNHYATITVSSGTKRVGCALAGSTWVLIAAEC
ncbi:MAG: hypothetical protein EBR82_47505 [Caulobacteraceae bacterium]|nr:hypothetical protein [Caulobacteraceae bacterium]